jgi:mono/diheme cytochrome c family protein
MIRADAVWLLALIAGMAGARLVSAQQRTPGNWEAPADAKGIQNPTPPDEKSLANGKRLFKQNCVPCHGESGRGDGATAKALGIQAGDLTGAERMKKHTDGEIFWKVSNGKDPMPVFKRKLSEKERWDLVNYVRTLH